jgi:hypothetical protein
LCQKSLFNCFNNMFVLTKTRINNIIIIIKTLVINFRLYRPAPRGKPQPHREGGELAPLLSTFQGVFRLQRPHRTEQQVSRDLLVEIRRENCAGKCIMCCAWP